MATIPSVLIVFLGAIIMMSLTVDSNPIPDPDPNPSPVPVLPLVAVAAARVAAPHIIRAAPKIIRGVSRKNNKKAYQNKRTKGTTERKGNKRRG
ncbi:hypothetical protein Anas_11129 [Armadillidium nasatum]|uniref:Transmembrane protein n=1 Tax=Armadillidium nasatum TaxID=96803 RepID=A0A5N5T8P5_9CRUS|nr:hypothetical protein Anas_11129 [Armadillidium nasatum]